jgi:hypothetical protein
LSQYYDASFPGAGYYVVIDHDVFSTNDYYTRYLHLSAFVGSGGSVGAGSQIGWEGSSGTYEQHLHFEINAFGQEMTKLYPWEQVDIPGTDRKNCPNSEGSRPAGNASDCYNWDDGVGLYTSITANTALTRIFPPLHPFGTFDVASRHPSGILVEGWAIDADLGSDPTQVHTYAYNGGTQVGYPWWANGARWDLPYPYGPYHGYSGAMPTAGAGWNQVCAYGINMAPSGSNTTIGCKDVWVQFDPFGYFDGMTRSNDWVYVWGWSIDPDLSSATVIHIYIDGQPYTGVWANQFRQDIWDAYPNYRAEHHGFGLWIPTGWGSHTICIYGINTAGPGGNALLTNGCLVG